MRVDLVLEGGGSFCQGADAVLAAVCGAEAEQGVRCGRGEGRGGDGRVEEEVVTAEEVEKKVRLVMESEEGEKLRERLAFAKEKAAEARADGGSSRVAFEDFLKDLKLAK
ncbi:hypothetical protein U9M48_044621 [Paspalum notatum var. saurae]|uniref:Uncharacterized protein n=1 Tax=Paspalum notatum var. saurae TaxID=547442 RepID=A0AAQ3XJQ3_PASNO